MENQISRNIFKVIYLFPFSLHHSVITFFPHESSPRLLVKNFDSLGAPTTVPPPPRPVNRRTAATIYGHGKPAKKEKKEKKWIKQINRMLFLTISHSIYKPASNDYHVWDSHHGHTTTFQSLVLVGNFMTQYFRSNLNNLQCLHHVRFCNALRIEARYGIIIINREYSKRDLFERVNYWKVEWAGGHERSESTVTG